MSESGEAKQLKLEGYGMWFAPKDKSQKAIDDYCSGDGETTYQYSD